MVITKKQHDELHNLSQPLMNWLTDNCHPHCEIHMDSQHLTLMEGITTVIKIKIKPKVDEDSVG